MQHATSHDDDDAPAVRSPGRVGRFVLEEELASGGMGTVYRARDMTSERQVALKRLKPQAAGREIARTLFEREYRTLHSLRHPRIIEVFEYGADPSGDYYTMELLTGADLHKLAPLSYPAVCTYLRDVASSLALLEARRLLHRDVTPRNIRVTEDGRCKLLDFGALTGFGVPSEVAGTPPFVPPEALRRAPLDQRADLYSLGATMYYMLTGRHAYPARSLSQLSELWTHEPPPPSEFAPDVPAALDALVMSLLQRDPIARPEHAAEVIDRLNAIGELPTDHEPQAAASYFFQTELIARSDALTCIDRALSATSSGRQRALLIRGAAGTGLSRLLGEACMRAQLAGAAVVQIDADRERREGEIPSALAKGLLAALPGAATRAAIPHADVLATAIPELAGVLEGAQKLPIPETPGEWRGRVQAAVSAWLTTIAQTQPLVIAVDNLEEADDPSAALLAALVADTQAQRLLVVVSLHEEASDRLTWGARYLQQHAETIELGPLQPQETLELAQAMFGAAPNVLRTGEWLHRSTGGVLSYCVELASELSRSGAARYVDGSWVLPDEAQLQELPSGMHEALQRRIARLTPASLRVAQALAVHASPLNLSTCRALALESSTTRSQLRDGHRLFASLDELVHAGILNVSGDRYRFVNHALRELLLSPLTQPERQRLHAAMAEALLSSTPDTDRMSRVEAGWHILRSGDDLRGAELLARTALGFEIGTGSLQAAVPALEEARRVYLQHDRSLYELLPIVTRLAAEGYYSDRRLSTRYAGEAFELLHRATGMDVAARIQPLVGRKLAVYLGLTSAALRFYATPHEQRLRAFSEVFVLLVNCVTTQAGSGTVCLDTEWIRNAASFIEPLTALGPGHMISAIHDYCIRLMQMTLECQPEVEQGWRVLLERLSDPAQFKALPDYVRQLYQGGALFALGIVETWHDGDDALQRADELEALGLRIYDRAAKQIRMLYYAGRAQMEQAEHFRRQMELHAIQTGSAWQVEVTVPMTSAVVYGALGDLVRLKHATEQIELLAERYGVESLARTGRSARATYLICRGSHEEAIAIYEGEDLLSKPRRFAGWARACGYLADAYNRLGRHRDALRVAGNALSHLRPEDRRFVRMFLAVEVQHAIARAGIGQVDDARRDLQQLLREHAPGQNPLTLGLIHEALATIAQLSNDDRAFERHARAVYELYEPTQVPTLVGRAGGLLRRDLEATAAAGSDDAQKHTPAHADSSMLATEFDQHESRDRRLHFALDIVLQACGAREGHLFVVEAGVARAAASIGGPVPNGCAVQAAAVAESFREDIDATRAEAAAATVTVGPNSVGHPGYLWRPLMCNRDGTPDLVAVVFIPEQPEHRDVTCEFLTAVAQGIRGRG